MHAFLSAFHLNMLHKVRYDALRELYILYLRTFIRCKLRGFYCTLASITRQALKKPHVQGSDVTLVRRITYTMVRRTFMALVIDPSHFQVGSLLGDCEGVGADTTCGSGIESLYLPKNIYMCCLMSKPTISRQRNILS